MTEAREGPGERPSPLTRLRLQLGQPRDIASLAALRVLFGALLCVSALRFIANGWVERFYGQRTFFFEYWGFEWVSPLSADGMLGVYLAIALLAALVCVGLFYRVAIVALFVLFTYAELTDVTNYLNHYYLVSLIALLVCFMPLSAAFSLDAKWGIARRRDALPAWMLGLLRFQVCVVYFYAAKAKWGADWLLRGQPLQGWLQELVDWPLVGGWLVAPGAAVLISWLGMLHDLCVPGLLLWSRTRGYAFAALLVFHAVTAGAFNIGIFPVLMPVLATVFFAGEWPRRWWGDSSLSSRQRRGGPRRAKRHEDVPASTARKIALTPEDLRILPSSGVAPKALWRSAVLRAVGAARPRAVGDLLRRRSHEDAAPGPSKDRTEDVTNRPTSSIATTVALGLYCLAQILIPLRSHLYGGNVLWHEQGMRYAWKVLVRAKHGSVRYRAELADGREIVVSPREFLTLEQEREMAGQPDLIVQLGHHVGAALRARGRAPLAVRVDALVAFNGRPAARLIDPEVDLLKIEDGLGKADWIAPAPP